MKYRIFSKLENKYIDYGFFMLMSGDLCTGNIVDGFEILDPADYIVELCTGLKDKNGREIFVGDILNSKNDGSDGCDIWDYSDHTNCVVELSPTTLSLYGLDDYFENTSVHSKKYIEVIGNVNENKELLNRL